MLSEIVARVDLQEEHYRTLVFTSRCGKNKSLEVSRKSKACIERLRSENMCSYIKMSRII